MPNQDRLKILLEISTKNLQALDTLNKRFEEVASKVNLLAASNQRLSTQLNTTQRRLDALATTSRATQQNVQTLTSAFRGLVWNLVRFEIVIRAIERVVGFLKDSFLATIKAAEEFKTAIVGIAAIRTTIASSVVPIKELGQYYEYAKEKADEFYKQLLAISAQTPVTTQQLFRMVTILEGYGQTVDLTNKKHRDAIVGLANAIFVLTQGQRLELQLLQETRGLLGATNKQYATLRRILEAIYPNLDKQLKLWVQQGTLLEHLPELLQPFTYAGKDIQETWQGITTTFRSFFDLLRKEAFTDWYNKVIKGLLNILKVFYEFDEQTQQFTGNLTSAGQQLVYTFRESINILEEAIGSVKQFSVFWKELIKSTNIALKAFHTWIIIVKTQLKILTSISITFWESIKLATEGIYGLIKAIKDLDASEAAESLQKIMYGITVPGFVTRLGLNVAKMESPIKKLKDIWFNDSELQQQQNDLEAKFRKYSPLIALEKSLSNPPELIRKSKEITKEYLEDYASWVRGLVTKLNEGILNLGFGDFTIDKFSLEELKRKKEAFENTILSATPEGSKLLLDWERLVQITQNFFATKEKLAKLDEISIAKLKLETDLLRAVTKEEKLRLTAKRKILDLEERIAKETDPAKRRLLEQQKQVVQENLRIRLAEEYSKKLIEQAEVLKKQREEREKALEILSTLNEKRVFATKKEKELYNLTKEYWQTVYKLQDLLNRKSIRPEEFDYAIDRLNEWYETEKELIEDKYDTHKRIAEEVKNIWQHTYEQLTDIVAQWLYNFNISISSLVDLVRKAAAQIGATLIVGGLQNAFAGISRQEKTGEATYYAFPGLGNLLTGGIRGLQSFFTAPEALGDWLFWNFEGPIGEAGFKLGQIFSSGFGQALGAGLTSFGTTYLFTKNLIPSLFSGIGSAAGWAIGGPIGALIGGIGGGLLGSVFGGKKKAPRVTFSADLVVDFIPGKGFQLAEIQLDTKRKYGAKPEYERQVRDAVNQFINQPIDWLNQLYQEVVADLPEEIRWRLDQVFADIDFTTQFSQRTHKSLKGDIDTRPLEKYVRDLLLTYEGVFEDAFKTEVKRGEQLLQEISPYLTEEAEKFIIETAKALFPEDVFDRLRNVPIEKIKGADFDKWLEENIKPLFDDIEAWEQFYDWATNYLSTVSQIIEDINRSLTITTALGQEVFQIAQDIVTWRQNLENLGLKPEEFDDKLRQIVDYRWQFALSRAFPDIIKEEDIYKSYLQKKYSHLNFTKDALNRILPWIINPLENWEAVGKAAKDFGVKPLELLADIASYVELAIKKITEENARIGNNLKDLYDSYKNIENLSSQISNKINEITQTVVDIPALISGIENISDPQKLYEEARKVYDLVIDRYREEQRRIDDLKRALEDSTRIIESLRDATSDILLSSSPSISAIVARRKYAELLAKARTGDKEAIQEYLSFTKEYLNIQKKVAATSEEYTNLQYKVIRDINDLTDVTEEQKRELERQLSNINRAEEQTVSWLMSIRNVIDSAKSDLVSSMQDLIDNLSPLAELPSILQDLAEILPTAQDLLNKQANNRYKSRSRTVTPEKIIEHYGGSTVVADTLIQVYSSGGADEVRNVLRKAAKEIGTSIEVVYKAAAKALRDTYKIDISNYVPLADGGIVTGPTFTLIGEKGYPEAVIPLPYGRNTFEAMVDELRALREENRQMRQELFRLNYEILKATKKTATTLQKWDIDGQPETRTT